MSPQCLCLAMLVVGLSEAAFQSGSCPPSVALRQCSPTCRQHDECPGALLCCGTVCGGTACIRPVTDVRRALQADDGDGGCCPKRGRCPPVVEGDWQCNSRCRGDFDCEGSSKCCLTRCGAMDCAMPHE